MPWSVGFFMTGSGKTWFLLTVETFSMLEKVWFLLWLHPLIFSEFFKNCHVFDLCDLEVKVGVIHLGDVTLTHQGPLTPKVSWFSHDLFMGKLMVHGYFHQWPTCCHQAYHMKQSSDWDYISIRHAAISQKCVKKNSAIILCWFSRFRAHKFI